MTELEKLIETICDMAGHAQGGVFHALLHRNLTAFEAKTRDAALEQAAQAAHQCPGRCHAQDDIDFHSGGVQMREHIETAIRALKEGISSGAERPSRQRDARRIRLLNRGNPMHNETDRPQTFECPECDCPCSVCAVGNDRHCCNPPCDIDSISEIKRVTALLKAAFAQVEAAQQRQMDLIRYARHFLHDENKITFKKWNAKS